MSISTVLHQHPFTARVAFGTNRVLVAGFPTEAQMHTWAAEQLALALEKPKHGGIEVELYVNGELEDALTSEAA